MDCAGGGAAQSSGMDGTRGEAAQSSEVDGASAGNDTNTPTSADGTCTPADVAGTTTLTDGVGGVFATFKEKDAIRVWWPGGDPPSWIGGTVERVMPKSIEVFTMNQTRTASTD